MAIIILLAFLFWASMASGAAPVAGIGCISNTTNAVSVSYPCTINAGSDRAVVMGIILAAGESVSSLSFAGSPVTSVSTVTLGGAAAQMHRQLNPPTGSQQLAYDVSAFSDTTGAVMQFTGVHQTTPTDTPATATGGPTTGSTLNTGSASGDLVVDLVHMCCTDCAASGTLDPGGGQTLGVRLYNVDLGGVTGMSTKAGAGSVTTTWACTTPETLDEWMTIGVSLNPVAAAATPPLRRRVQ
jgi:hypothetical protein